MKTHTIFKTITIGGKSKEQYIKELKAKSIQISYFAQDLLGKTEFQKKEELVELTIVKVSDLGISQKYPTTEQIYKKAEELGLELCPSEVGPALRLASKSKEWIYVGMKQIADSNGRPHVFSLVRGGDGLWLYDGWAEPGDEWNPGDQFVFRLRKSLENSDTLDSLDSLVL